MEKSITEKNWSKLLALVPAIPDLYIGVIGRIGQAYHARGTERGRRYLQEIVDGQGGMIPEVQTIAREILEADES